MLPLDSRPLPCPECRFNGRGGGARIGNNRSNCKTCNRFSQRVMRAARQRMAESNPVEYTRIRLQVEIELYRNLVADWGTGTLSALDVENMNEGLKDLSAQLTGTSTPRENHDS